VTAGKQTVILLGSVTPAAVSSFYMSALPQAGYKITENTLTTVSGGTGAAIEFTGHGYKGIISAESNIDLATAGVSMSGVSGKNFVGITLSPQ